MNPNTSSSSSSSSSSLALALAFPVQDDSDRQDISAANKRRCRPEHIPGMVQHKYKDRCHEEGKLSMPLSNWTRLQKSPTAPFPVKTHHMLECVERDDLTYVVSWQPHGRCFIIHKLHDFTTTILPRYMNLSKLASFQRQLNLYGFGRITQGPDKGGIYHEFFLKNRGPLALEIHRIKFKGTGVRAKSNPDQEPNFWNMPNVLPYPPQQQQHDDDGEEKNQHYVDKKMDKDDDDDNSKVVCVIDCSDDSSVISELSVDVEIAHDDEKDEVVEQTQKSQSPLASPPPPLAPANLPSLSLLLLNRNKVMTNPFPPSAAADIILTEWGMPFHALDDVPDDILPTTAMPLSKQHQPQTFPLMMIMPKNHADFSHAAATASNNDANNMVSNKMITPTMMVPPPPSLLKSTILPKLQRAPRMVSNESSISNTPSETRHHMPHVASSTSSRTPCAMPLPIMSTTTTMMQHHHNGMMDNHYYQDYLNNPSSYTATTVQWESLNHAPTAAGVATTTTTIMGNAAGDDDGESYDDILEMALQITAP